MLLPVLATVYPNAEGVRLAVTDWPAFVTVCSLPSPSHFCCSSMLVSRLVLRTYNQLV